MIIYRIDKNKYTKDARFFDEHLRAPKGGITLKGKEFRGGEFIPSEGGYQEEFKKKKAVGELKPNKPSEKSGEGKTKQKKVRADKKKVRAVKAKIKNKLKKVRQTSTTGFTPAKRDAKGKIVLSDGKALPEHLQHAAIAPAWRNLLINPDKNGKCWLVATDDKGKAVGRIYNPKHIAERDVHKDSMLHDLNKNLDVINNQLEKDWNDEQSQQKAVIAKIIAMTGARVGSSEKELGAKGKTYGVTTLEGRHIIPQADGSVQLDFIGKDSKRNIYEVKDKNTIKMLLKLKKDAGDDGKLFREKYNDVLDYVKELDGGGFTPKNFRTKIGTDTAIENINKMPAPTNLKEYKKALKAVATKVSERLNNTPAIALKSYIVSSVFSDWKMKAGIA
jgi:DNA topoisomerase I